jgi:hypothetical protein
MSLPNPAELISQMAIRLKRPPEHRAISEPRYIGIRTGGVWVAQALLKELGSDAPWARWTFPSTATTSARTACTRKCVRRPCRSRSKASTWC